MQGFKIPKDNERYRWTNHVVRKMMHYRLTPARVMRVVRAPERIEEGVAPGTHAGMHRSGSRDKPTEIWAMWREEKPKSKVRSKNSEGKKVDLLNSSLDIHTSPLLSSRKVIITAWRYPGVSPVRDVVPIPDDVMSELEAEGLLDE